MSTRTITGNPGTEERLAFTFQSCSVRRGDNRLASRWNCRVRSHARDYDSVIRTHQGKVGLTWVDTTNRFVSDPRS